MPNKKTISSLALMNSSGTAEDEEVEEEVLDGDDSGSSSVTSSLSDKSWLVFFLQLLSSVLTNSSFELNFMWILLSFFVLRTHLTGCPDITSSPLFWGTLPLAGVRSNRHSFRGTILWGTLPHRRAILRYFNHDLTTFLLFCRLSELSSLHLLLVLALPLRTTMLNVGEHLHYSTQESLLSCSTQGSLSSCSLKFFISSFFARTSLACPDISSSTLFWGTSPHAGFRYNRHSFWGTTLWGTLPRCRTILRYSEYFRACAYTQPFIWVILRLNPFR